MVDGAGVCVSYSFHPNDRKQRLSTGVPPKGYQRWEDTFWGMGETLGKEKCSKMCQAQPEAAEDIILEQMIHCIPGRVCVKRRSGNSLESW